MVGVLPICSKHAARGRIQVQLYSSSSCTDKIAIILFKVANGPSETYHCSWPAACRIDSIYDLDWNPRDRPNNCSISTTLRSSASLLSVSWKSVSEVLRSKTSLVRMPMFSPNVSLLGVEIEVLFPNLRIMRTNFAGVS